MVSRPLILSDVVHAGSFMLCSSSLLIINKICAMHNDPYIVLWAQVGVSAAVALLFARSTIQWKRFSAFFGVSVAFLACLSANMHLLKNCNVETFIIFRNSTPLLISVCDWFFLKRELPDSRSVGVLFAMIASSVAYTVTDSSFSLRGYLHVAIWYVIFCFDAIFIKKRVDQIEVDDNWERVLYQNTWSLVLLGLKFGYDQRVPLLDTTRSNLLALGAGCAVGVGISYFSLSCRKRFTATYFALLGNVCKIVTVMINLTIWDKHASHKGLACLVVSIACGYFYRQAPLREESTPSYAQISSVS